VSERQRKIINRLLDGFEGKLTTEKWGKLGKVSHDTALRDIQDLIKKGILRQEEGGGRRTGYALRPARIRVQSSPQPQNLSSGTGVNLMIDLSTIQSTGA